MNNALEQNKASWGAMADSWFGTTALPNYGCYIPTEDDFPLFADLAGKALLDVGCGSGRSLLWCEKKALSICGALIFPADKLKTRTVF